SLTLEAAETERLLAETNDWTVRFKMPADRIVQMDDMIRGHVEVNTRTLDDKVLWKRADELPTYHLANIVDDHLMEITEVIRGEEWLPSLPLHYLLYEAFGWQDTMPRFAHLSLLLKPDGKGKLSKRDGDKMGFPVFPLRWTSPDGEVSRGYREDGYFPEAFVNLLAMLGWNPGDERELFTLDELVEAFSIDRIVKSGARFNPDKAKWYNKEYLRRKSPAELCDAFIPVLEEKGVSVTDGDEKDFASRHFGRGYVEKVVALIQERASFVRDFWDIASYLFVSPTEYVEKDAAKFWKTENTALAFDLAAHISAYDKLLEKEGFEKDVEEYIKSREWPMGKVMNCLRLALVGASSGLGIADIVCLIGLEEFGRRIEHARNTLGA
ncbi:MAG: glutamate--tRNA ligase, partial [Bacteroidales bacterium]|nr:glutamate--tRNA ligase [Bacteroidales bacterium]